MCIITVECERTHLDLFPEEFLSVVEASKVLVLPQEFNGRLRAIGVQLGHVEIVNKYDHFLSRWST